MTKLLNFESYLGSLNESYYQVPDVKQTSEGGYELIVLDFSEGQEGEKFDRIFISKKNDKSIGLSFIGKNGEEQECLWIPKEAIGVRNSGDSLEIKIRPYSKWMMNPENCNKLEDFIEDFADRLESSKIWGSNKMKRQAQDDVEVLLDLFDHDSAVKSFDECGENQWDAELEDGKIIEITKRNPEDLMATFKVFPDKNSSSPTLTIVNKHPNPKTIFNVDPLGRIEIDGILIGSRNQNPYFKYLIKKCLGTETSADQSLFYDYFQDFVTKKNYKSDEVKNMVKLLSGFMDQNEINSLISRAL
jgi:hypothetical protein